MHKEHLSFEELKTIAQQTADHIKATQTNYTLVAVSRGGLMFAQCVAYNLSKPLSFFIPSTGLWPTPNKPTTLIFLEDLVAKGRTVNTIDSQFKDWLLYPVITDVNAPKHEKVITEFCKKPNHWVVFPHEVAERTVVGDWGLFREGTSANSKSS